MEPLVIEFIGEPVAKGRPRISIGDGKPVAYTPAKTRKYEAALAYAVREAMGNHVKRFLGPVSMSVVASLPIPQSWSLKKQKEARAGRLYPVIRPDADNYLKLAADACNGVAFNDDKQIVFAMVSKRYSEAPMLRIEIAPMETLNVSESMESLLS